jgi:uncharacterized protein YggE
MRLRTLLLCSNIALVMATAATVALAAEPPVRTIKVSAMRSIEVVPDEVVLSLSVVAEDDNSPITAKTENDKRTRAILAALKKHRVEDKYIKIDCLEIQPIYHSNSRELIRYTVTRGIDVTLQDFSILEPILSDALRAGANRVSGILFRTTKHRDHQFEVRRLAVAYAKEKAGHLAELNDLTLGKAITIEEDVEGDSHTLGSGGGMGGMGGASTSDKRTPKIVLVGMAKDRTAADAPAQAAADAGQTIAPGTITISATVTITFELREPAH